MMLLAVVVALIPYICPISPVTGIETATTPPWEPAVDEAVPAVRIVGGEITSIKKYPFIVCVRRAHPSHAHSPLTFHLSRASVLSHITRTCVTSLTSKNVKVTRGVLCKIVGVLSNMRSWHGGIFRDSTRTEREFINFFLTLHTFFLTLFRGVRLFQFLASSLKWYDMMMTCELMVWLTYLAVYASGKFTCRTNSNQRYRFY